jgi:hypothetical protein
MQMAATLTQTALLETLGTPGGPRKYTTNVTGTKSGDFEVVRRITRV